MENSIGTPEMSRRQKRDEAIRKKAEADLIKVTGTTNSSPNTPGGNSTPTRYIKNIQSNNQNYVNHYSGQAKRRTNGNSNLNGMSPNLNTSINLNSPTSGAYNISPKFKPTPGSVLALKPSPALQIRSHTLVSEAARLMSARRENCVLVTDNDRPVGIFTSKDLAFRVVGAGLDPSKVTVENIMTPNPLTVRDDSSATDALNLMVEKGFRHLPVMDEKGDIVGVLDIAKCFYEAMERLERAYNSSRKLYDALEGIQTEIGSSHPAQIFEYANALRQKLSGPDVSSILERLPEPVYINVKSSVKQAAMLMREYHTTAVMVTDQSGAITGIFTSKDIVLRVIAAGIDPNHCSVIRVMTPHPDFAYQDLSIQAALRKMHTGRYLNLPIMNIHGEVLGVVDVLTLTYATLEQINNMHSNNSNGNAESVGPAWDKFWASFDQTSDSALSESPPGAQRNRYSQEPGTNPQFSPNSAGELHDNENGNENYHNESNGAIEDSEILPNDSASQAHNNRNNASSVNNSKYNQNNNSLRQTSTSMFNDPRINRSSLFATENPSIPVPFKFKAPSGRVHRVSVSPNQGVDLLRENINKKLTVGDLDTLTKNMDSSLYSISYIDDDGDVVGITSDEDLVDSINIAFRKNAEKVDLLLHHPDIIPEVNVPAPAPSSAVGTPSPDVNNGQNGYSCGNGFFSPTDSTSTNVTVPSQSPNSEIIGSRREDSFTPNKLKKSMLEDETDVKKNSKVSKKYAQERDKNDDSLIPGVPNEALLPGAVMALAVSILFVFALRR